MKMLKWDDENLCVRASALILKFFLSSSVIVPHRYVCVQVSVCVKVYEILEDYR